MHSLLVALDGRYRVQCDPELTLGIAQTQASSFFDADGLACRAGKKALEKPRVEAAYRAAHGGDFPAQNRVASRDFQECTFRILLQKV